MPTLVSSRAAAPKPNTRFLRNILRDTDNHNAALLAKEAQESKHRLDALRRTATRPAQQLYSARQRHDSKTTRLDPADKQPSTRHSSDSHRRSSRRSRSRSPDRQSSRRHHRKRSLSPSRHNSHKSRRRSSSPEPRRTTTKPSRHHRPSEKRHSSPSDASDSDPLDAIIGPAPPPANPPLRSRGRGALNNSSTIDDHFSSNYDPSADLQPDSYQDEPLDWDQALEALRDRQKWRQQGADRLRAAGFSERDVNKWEKGADKSEDDVVWAKKGEGREWDRGKVVDEHGLVEFKPEWGRLKDS